jgi:hypothetical protein
MQGWVGEMDYFVKQTWKGRNCFNKAETRIEVSDDLKSA